MYCANCGSSMPESLNYCKNCGARNERNALIVSNSSGRPLGIAAVVIGGFGLFGFYPVLRELLHSPLDPAVIVILMVAYLAAVVLMFSILVGHIWKNAGDIRIKGAERADTYQPPASFRAVNTAQLEEPREMPLSVTDHTTRTLDEVPITKY
jgi:hypothetical protein